MPYAIGIDLGGTNIKLAALSESGETLDRAAFETHDQPRGGWAERIRTEVKALQARRGEAARTKSACSSRSAIFLIVPARWAMWPIPISSNSK